MKDPIGDRMKDNYESRSKYFLPRRSYIIIRIDGKAFHTYTKGLERPFDEELIEDMNSTAIELCKQIQGAKFAFVQSDEISILLTDFENLNTEAWFDNNIQKICSISASIATAKFNQLRNSHFYEWWNSLRDEDVYTNEEKRNYEKYLKIAHFDSRVFQIPSRTEVENYFIWRQQDTVRNSIQSVAQSLYSHKELENKNSNDLQEMIFQKGINWNDYNSKYKRGRIIVKEIEGNRSKWISSECPTFTQKREFITNLIPVLE